jgi:dynamin 1-like protein
LVPAFVFNNHPLTSLQELERFPRLHAQIVETVSELLRERLGPTSDYTQSLIAIQTSYINTNHPAFVASTQNLSKENAQPPRKPLTQRPAAHIDPPTINGVTSDEDNAEDTDRAEAILTGNRKDHRSASTSAAARSSSASRHHHHHRHSNTTSPATTSNPQRPNPPQFLNQPPNTTKESFLNYFFGQGQGQGTNSMGGAASSAAVAGTTLSSTALMGSTSTSEVKPDEPDDGMSSGLLAPRRGLDGNTAAFDMRSLEKHIEAVSHSLLGTAWWLNPRAYFSRSLRMGIPTCLLEKKWRLTSSVP